MTFLTYNNEAVSAPREATNRVINFFKRNKVQKLSFWISTALCIVSVFGYSFIQYQTEGLVFTTAAVLPFSVFIVVSFLLTSRASLKPSLRLFALLWGAYGSTSLTFILINAQNGIFGASNTMDSVVVQAAVIEELSKAAFLFLLLFTARSSIRTPLNGAVLGILVGAGFAFFENILYFASAYATGGWEAFLSTFFARAVMSLFIHPLSTMLTGIFIGYVVSRKLPFWKNSLLLVGGLAAAMTTHGLWNGFASLTTDNWTNLYLLFWFPYVAVMITTVLVVKKLDTRKRKTALDELAKNAYLTLRQTESLGIRRERKKLYRRLDSFSLAKWEHKVYLLSYWKQATDVIDGSKKTSNKRRSKLLTKQTELVSAIQNNNPGV